MKQSNFSAPGIYPRQLKISVPTPRSSEIALEFVKSYAHFVQELVEHDLKIKLQRSDIEIRDLISHVNMLMRKKYELTFTAMVYNSPSHYRKILEKILSGEKDNQES